MNYSVIANKFYHKYDSNIYIVALSIEEKLRKEQNISIDFATILLIIKLIVWLIQRFLFDYSAPELSLVGRWLIRRAIRQKVQDFFVQTTESYASSLKELQDAVATGIVDQHNWETIYGMIKEVKNADV